MFEYHTKRKDKYYDQVIQLYTKNHLSYRGIAKIIPLTPTTIRKWIINFAETHPDVQLRMKPIKATSKISFKTPTSSATTADDLSTDVQTLQKELLEMKEKLRKEKLRADAYDTMIEIAESTFKIPIRKKSGAKR